MHMPSYISFCTVVIVDSKASFAAGYTYWVSGVKSGPGSSANV